MLKFLKIKKNGLDSGFTLIEILIVLFVIVIISSIVVLSLSKFRNEQALKNETTNIISFINKTKQNTLSSVNSVNYGVHFETDQMTLFVGPIYIDGAETNEVVTFSSLVEIPILGGLNIGGGSDVIFERLTGETTGGTIILQLKSDATKQKTITISRTGVISSN